MDNTLDASMLFLVLYCLDTSMKYYEVKRRMLPTKVVATIRIACMPPYFTSMSIVQVYLCIRLPSIYGATSRPQIKI